MKQAREWLDWARQRLGGTEEAANEALLLLAHLLHKDRSWLFAWPEAEVDAAVGSRYADLIGRRAQGEPVAYLTGQREFWSLPLQVDPNTLIPRPETEHLVEFVLARIPATLPARVLDLGTGSGAIALAIASERPDWQVSATDFSRSALAVASANAGKLGLGVRFLQANWLEGISGPFDLIISNPPYVADQDHHLRSGDTVFEPPGALASGADGLRDIRIIVHQAAPQLAPGGWLVFEHGFDQGADSRALLRERGYREVGTGRDLAGHERFSFGRIGDTHAGKPY